MTRRADRGAVLPLAAVSMGVLILFTSFAVDLGRARMERRDLQSVADAVAFDMIRRIDQHANAAVWDPAIVESRNRNEFPAAGTETDDVRDLVVTPGCYVKTTDVFTAFGTSPCTTVPDAVHVVARDTIDYHFRPGEVVTSREAIAVQPEKAQFQVGSFIANVDPAAGTLIGGFLNAVMPSLLPLPVLDPSVTAGGYSGLVDANVAFGNMIPYLPVTAGSPEELLDTQVTVYDLMVASAGALRAQGNAADAAFLESFTGDPAVATELQQIDARLGDVLGVDTGGSAGADTVVNVPQVLLLPVVLSDGEHFITVPDAVVNIPYVGDIQLSLTGIEGPRKNTDLNDGGSATTRQVDLRISPHIDFSTTRDINVCSLPTGERGILHDLIAGILGPLGCLANILGVVQPVLRTFTIDVDATPTIRASAGEVTVVQSINCGAKQLTLTPTPVAVNVTSALALTARVLLGTTQLPITLNVNTTGGATTTGSAAPVTFNATDAGPRHVAFNPRTARVGANPLGLANVLNVGATEMSATSSGLSVTASLVLPGLQSALNAMLAQLDQMVIQPLAQLFGITLAGADLTPLWMDCATGGPSLSR